MTNEEKSKEIVKSAMAWWEDADYTIKDIEKIMTNVGCQMAAWKEQQMIDKAYKWLQNHTMKELCMKEEDGGLVQSFIESFEDYMKGE